MKTDLGDKNLSSTYSCHQTYFINFFVTSLILFQSMIMVIQLVYLFAGTKLPTASKLAQISTTNADRTTNSPIVDR
jgi:hypothetical protein